MRSTGGGRALSRIAKNFIVVASVFFAIMYSVTAICGELQLGPFHWKHLRTTNPIESSFATVRHRTVRSKGCLSNKTALAMIFKLAEAAEKSWRRLDGHNQLPKIILGVRFTDGIEVVKPQAQAAAA